MISSKKLYFATIDSNNIHDSALLYQIHTFKSKTKIIKKYPETFANQWFCGTEGRLLHHYEQLADGMRFTPMKFKRYKYNGIQN